MGRLLHILTFIVLVNGNYVLSAQEYELRMDKVKHDEIQRTKVFEEGEVLVFRTLEGTRYKGVFAVHDNTSIRLENGQIVFLNQIKKIRKPNGKLLGGLTLVTLGGLAFAGGLSALVLETFFGDTSDDGPEIATILGLAGLIGGSQLIANYNFKLKKSNWKLSIVQK